MKKVKIYLGYFVIITSLLSCEKYLDAKPDKSLATISTLDDMQSLLDDYLRLNNQTVSAAIVASDDYYVKDAAFDAITKEGDKRIYSWQKGNQFEGTLDGWYYAYLNVYYGNSVLEHIKNIKRNSSNSSNWDNIKGQALFFKGNGMLFAASVWCPPFEEATATTTMGLPIRESTDFNIKSNRASLAETYKQLLEDLKAASHLLPITQIHPMRPSKVAAFAMLSRAYLMMNKYTEAVLYADSALQINNTLTDYNDINSTATNPFLPYKGEVIFHLSTSNPSILNQSNAIIVDELYQQYAADDLRKSIFFRNVGLGTYAFKGNYTGGSAQFVGPAVDEMYLNRAEGNARLNNLPAALADLNALLIKRWNKQKIYPKYESNIQETIIEVILKERRKELLMRGLRWSDLKRLNKLGNKIDLKRSYNNLQYDLPANDSRYAMSIPEEVIQLSGMLQNP